MTKVHITNLYGMAGDSTVILAQNAVTDIARCFGGIERLESIFIISLQIVRVREASV